MSIVSSERDLDEGTLIISSLGRHAYGEEYKTKVFMVWYKLGKPGGGKLFENIDIDAITGGKPSIPVLRNWIITFKEQAAFLDSQVARELEERMVAEKIEMLDRHAKAGVKMQDMAVKYLDEHANEIKVPFAVKMLVEGIRIERESRGIPQALAKMLDKTDDDLLKEVIALVNKSPVEFEQIESTIEIDNGDENG